MADLPLQIAETIQTAHIDHHPDPLRDNAPETSVDRREILTPKREYDDVESSDEDDDDDIPYSVLRPTPRSQKLPPLPDLRFEQSYLNSISNADRWWKVALITARDQVMMPLAQGLVYNLLLCGWQQWNQTAKVHGNTYGARVRRWWYGVNNWSIPGKAKAW